MLIHTAELLFPSFCYGCKKSRTYFCDDCRETLSSFSYALCPHCKIRLPQGKLLRKGCRYELQMKRVFSCAPYNDKLLQRLLKDFKYGRAHALAKPLAQYAIWWLSKNEYLGDIKTNIDFIVPVPMHKRKQKSRGFNHAQYLAEEFSKLVDIPSATDILVKTRKTKPQAETENEQERQENLKNALALAPSSDALHEKNVLLIDDIATTGSTLRECSIALKPAKPKEIWALTIAQD